MSASTKRFAVYDTNPIGTLERESAARGEPVFLCGKAEPKLLDVRDARNAADAVQAARGDWPEIPVRYLTALEVDATEVTS